jgi:hypothetical protein
MSQKLLSASAVAREVGIATSTFLELYREGIADSKGKVIEADIHEGKLIRFHPSKVEQIRKILAKRAERHRTATTLPAGMVPTF